MCVYKIISYVTDVTRTLLIAIILVRNQPCSQRYPESRCVLARPLNSLITTHSRLPYFLPSSISLFLSLSLIHSLFLSLTRYPRGLSRAYFSPCTLSIPRPHTLSRGVLHTMGFMLAPIQSRVTIPLFCPASPFRGRSTSFSLALPFSIVLFVGAPHPF